MLVLAGRRERALKLLHDVLTDKQYMIALTSLHETRQYMIALTSLLGTVLESEENIHLLLHDVVPNRES